MVIFLLFGAEIFSFKLSANVKDDETVVQMSLYTPKELNVVETLWGDLKQVAQKFKGT